MNDTTTLRMERTFQAPAHAVFDAWTSEEVLRRWWHAAHDWETTEASVDLRLGGEMRVVMRDPHKDVDYGGGGRYTEIDPPARPVATAQSRARCAPVILGGGKAVKPAATSASGVRVLGSPLGEGMPAR